MTSSPIFVLPEEIIRPVLAYGGSAFICRRETAPGEIIKIPIRLDTTGCSPDVCEEAEAEVVFSKECIAREKYIRSILPHHDGILRYLGESGNGLRFPYLQKGHLRDYLRNHQHEISDETRYNWIETAIDSVAFLQLFGVDHCDLSARNLLVDDDGSVKLSDFAGSSIDELPPLVKQEVRYRQVHGVEGSVHSVHTEIFAIGSLIYEIMIGSRPYDEIEDDEEVMKRYGSKDFPCLHGIECGDIIYKCWTQGYGNVDEVLHAVKQHRAIRTGQQGLNLWILCLTILCIASLVLTRRFRRK